MDILKSGQKIFIKNNLIQILTIASIWICIFSSVYISEKINSYYLIFVCSIFIGILQHYLLVMLHESVHQSFFFNSKLHDYLSDIFLALPCLMYTKHYRNFHLKHHDRLGTSEDPENDMKTFPKWNFPKKNLTQLLAAYFLIVSEQSLIVRLKRIYTAYADRKNHLSYKIFTLSYFFILISLILYTKMFKIFFIYWAIPLFLILPFLLRIRNLAEHVGIKNEKQPSHSRDVKGTWCEVIFLVPLNANYHLTHHLYPKIPWYNLKKASQKIRETENINQIYLYESYLGKSNSVLRELHL